MKVSTKSRSFTVTSIDVGTKLDKLVRKVFADIVPSKSQCHTAFKNKQVLVNNEFSAEGYRVKVDDVITVLRSEAEAQEQKHGHSHFPFDIACEEDHFAIIHKPCGVTLCGQPENTLQHALKYRLQPYRQDHDALETFECMNFIEKAASGLCIIAKSKTAFNHFKQLQNVELVHRCIVHGKVGADANMQVGDEFAIEEEVASKEAITLIRVVEFTKTRNSPDGYLTTIDAVPVFGFVSNQIRAHLYYRYPVIGNSRFTKLLRSARDKGLFLAVTQIELTHPVTKKKLVFEWEEPPKFQALRDREERFVEEKDLAEEVIVETIPESDPPVAGWKNAAYKRGYQEFWGGLQFRVTPDVMIPRQATITVVDAAIDLFFRQNTLDCLSSRKSAIRILDIGTGSGCILVSLAKGISKELESKNIKLEVSGVGLDISAKALEVAKTNQQLHSMEGCTEFLECSFADIPALAPSLAGPFDVVVCNPPYLSQSMSQKIDASRLLEEPSLAIFADEGGYASYRTICESLHSVPTSFWPSTSVVALEVGHGMAAAVRRIFDPEVSSSSARSRFIFEAVVKDSRRLERCILLTHVSVS